MKRVISLLREHQLLVLVVAFAAVIRLVGLSLVPSSLNWDEVSLGYNAYSILQTGKDEWGESWPTIFRAYGDYKLPGYVYVAVPRVAVFGLNEIGVRLTSVIAGVLLVVFTYILTLLLFKKKEIALLSALFVAIEPWSFFLSRVAVEANLALFFIVAGITFFVAGLKRQWFLILSSIFLGLSVWTYNSARIFVPLLLLSMILIYRKEIGDIWKKSRSIFAFCFLLFALFFIPMFYQLLNPTGQARYRWLAILDQGAISQINESRNSSQLPEPFPIVVHNKVTFFASKFTENYLSHSSPRYLFLDGGSHYQFSVPGKGLIYPTEAIFILIGLILLFKRRDKASLLILSWLLLSPIASSLTREGAHPLRSIVMQPVQQILAALGLIGAWQWWNRKIKYQKSNISKAWPFGLKYVPVFIYVVLLLFFFESYAREYVGNYRTNYSWAWQYGYKEAVHYIKQNYDNYDRIIMTKKYGEPHEFILFYWPWDPEKYRTDPNLIRFGQSDWFWVDRFDKFYFVNDWQIPGVEGGEWKMESGGGVPTDGRTLLITSSGNYPPGWNKVKTINFLDGKPAFEILEKI